MEGAGEGDDAMKSYVEVGEGVAWYRGSSRPAMSSQGEYWGDVGSMTVGEVRSMIVGEVDHDRRDLVEDFSD
jgi:hypothetical protein